MGKYGTAAVMATKLYEGLVSSPNDAWVKAVTKVFPSSESSQKKGCPRGAYLGLCENGFIRGVPKGDYCRSKKNKEYALKAVELLKQDKSLLSDEKRLWDIVMDGEEKKPNHQMDVVISLWNEGLICV